MPIVNLMPFIRSQFFDANGNPLAGGTVGTFIAGTSTPQATYTDSTGSILNTNPVVLDSSGTASIWLIQNAAYKFVIKNSGGVTIETIDNVLAAFNSATSFGPQTQVFTGSGTFTIPTAVTAVKVTVVAGGGAGGGSTVANMGGGGSAGGCSIKWLTGLTPGLTLTVTVGPGGTGASGAAGGNGGVSSVTSGTQTITTITTHGGIGGASTAVPVLPNVGGAAGTGGDINIGGGASVVGVTGASGGGGGSIFGGGGSGAGGGPGNVPLAYGAGAGGSFVGSTQTGPNGFGGVVIFEWVA